MDVFKQSLSGSLFSAGKEQPFHPGKSYADIEQILSYQVARRFFIAKNPKIKIIKHSLNFIFK
jgi:hypothetical protein